MKSKKDDIPSQLYDIEAEQGVLACFLVDFLEVGTTAYYKVFELLKPAYFFLDSNALIYSLISDLATAGKSSDIITVIGHAKDNGVLDEIGGLDYLSELTRILPNANNVEEYAGRVKDKYVLRRVFNGLDSLKDRLVSDAIKPVNSLTDITENIISRLLKMCSNITSSSITPVKKALEQVYSTFNTSNIHSLIETGFSSLDDVIGGLMGGSLYVIAARPGIGKTSLALSIVRNIAVNSRVMFCSLEMTSMQLAQRLLSAESGVSCDRIVKNKLSDSDYESIARYVEDIATLKLAFIEGGGAVDNSRMTVEAIRSRAKIMQNDVKSGGLGLIVIDYLQLMEGEATGIREQEVAKIVRGLKLLAKELHVPIIALAQLNRQVESRVDKRPLISDLRESGAIEQDADVILLLYRDGYYNRDPKAQKIITGYGGDRTAYVAEINVAKNRMGDTARIEIGFQPETAKFISVVKHERVTF